MCNCVWWCIIYWPDQALGVASLHKGLEVESGEWLYLLQKKINKTVIAIDWQIHPTNLQWLFEVRLEATELTEQKDQNS